MYDSFNGTADNSHSGDKTVGIISKTDVVVNTNASQIDQSLKFRGASAGVKSVGKLDKKYIYDIKNIFYINFLVLIYLNTKSVWE